MLNEPPRNLGPRELRVKIPPELDVKIRMIKLMTGIGLSELVVQALEQHVREIARERRRALHAEDDELGADDYLQLGTPDDVPAAARAAL